MEDIPIANDNVEDVLNLGTLQDRRREATRLYEEIRQGWIKISMKIRLDVRKILEVYDAAGRDISRTSMSIIRMVSLMNETFRTAVGEMHVKDVAEDTYLLASEQPGTSGTASKKDRAKVDEKQKTDSKTKQSESKEENREENEGHRRKTSREERSESKEGNHEEDEGHRSKSSRDNNERAKSSRSRENSRDIQPESKDDNREEDGGHRRKKDNSAKIKSSRDRESSRRN